jgi:small subunit ribosomal protein S17
MAEDQTEQETAVDAPETAAETAPTPDAPQARQEPEEVLEPKERRRRARAVKTAREQARPQRTPEERHAERLAERRGKAQERRAGRAKAKAKAPAATHSEPTAPRPTVAGVQKVRQGVVISDRANKTITVRIDTARRHRRYDKIVRTSRTLHAHDEANDANIGDTVVVREARPLSRTKRWRLIEVIERAK